MVIIQITCFLLLLQDVCSRNFLAKVIPEMNDMIPTTSDIKVSSSEECAIFCADDVTCASFSYSDKEKKCFLSSFEFKSYFKEFIKQETGQQYKHFVLNEYDGKDPVLPGYRIHKSASLTVRYFFIRHYTCLQAPTICLIRGGAMAVLNTKEKWNVVIDDIKANKLLKNEEKGFCIGAIYDEVSGVYYWTNKREIADELVEKTERSGPCVKLTAVGETFKIMITDCSEELAIICNVETPYTFDV